MIFWRKKNNAQTHTQDERDNDLMHPAGEPEIEPIEDSANTIDCEETLHKIEDDAEPRITDINITPTRGVNNSDNDVNGEDDHADEGGWLSRLTLGLSKSSNKISSGISDILTKQKLDQTTLNALEDILISADLGPTTAAKIIADFSQDRFEKGLNEIELKEMLSQAITKILEPVATPLFVQKPQDGPFTILVCGVNGVGKTTTIGKLAQNYTMKERMSVMLAAGDTFRAAAIEQLEIWAKRTHATFYGKDLGADAAAVAFEAYDKAKSTNTDIVLIDTAGRLHNKTNLMNELSKMVRVLKKRNDTLPHECLLVLDATTGQNAIAQVETFKKMVNVTGLVVTKLDGSARGGIVVTLADQFKIPIYAIGVGETAEDLQPFHAKEFADSLVGLID